MKKKTFGAAILKLKGSPKMPSGLVAAPSHLTVRQAATLLEVTRSAIHARIKRGTLSAPVWYGEKMIPSAEIVEAIRKKREGK